MSDYPFTNRELSWLRFNERVLKQAEDSEVPLLERLKFLAIFSSNLDEFYMVRVAGLKDLKAAGYTKKGLSGLSPEEQLIKIDELSRSLTKSREKLYKNNVKELKQHDIRINHPISGEIEERLESIFIEEMLPLLSPITLSPTNPMPFIFNNRLCLMVQLMRSKQFYLSVIIIPDNLKRLYQIKVGDCLYCYTAEEIIRFFVNRIFPDYNIVESIVIRVTRNADLTLEEEEAEDLLFNIKKKLNLRNKGNIVRVEVDRPVPESILDDLSAVMQFDVDDMFVVNSVLDLKFLFGLAPGYPQLRYKDFDPIEPQYIPGESVFDMIKRQDILQFRPYQNLSLLSRMVNEAAADDNVIAIKMTLYRANRDSSIIKALADAARNGKHVCVVVEIKARFDEESNVEWAKQMEDAGCIVTYGIFGLKIHAKSLLIVRREEGKIVRYTHVATGNYNETTAHIYNDIDYVTANEQVGANASNLFNFLMGYTDHATWTQMTIAPINLRNKLIECIDNEIANAKKGLSAKVLIKLNSLLDKVLIHKLYEASQAGVEVKAIVRGICSLQPGLPGISENIRVKSIIGRFLEHARIYVFHNNGEDSVYLSSADWMDRNMDRRVEILLKIEDERSRCILLKIMNYIWEDNVKSWELVGDIYRKMEPNGEPLNYQETLIENYTEFMKCEKFDQ